MRRRKRGMRKDREGENVMISVNSELEIINERTEEYYLLWGKNKPTLEKQMRKIAH